MAYLSKAPALGFVGFLCCFAVCSDLCCDLSSVALGLICSPVSSFPSCTELSSLFVITSFLRWIRPRFPSSVGNFQFPMISPLTRVLFKCFGFFPQTEFPTFPLLRISNVIPLCLEKILCISTFQSLLRLKLCSDAWSVPEKASCELMCCVGW